MSGNKRHADDDLVEEEAERTPRKTLFKAPNTPGTPRRTNSKLKDIPTGLTSFKVNMPMPVVSSPRESNPGTPRSAAEALPVLARAHSPPAASVFSQLAVAFNVAKESMAVNMGNPSLDQSMSIRAFSTSVPAEPASPCNKHMSIARATTMEQLPFASMDKVFNSSSTESQGSEPTALTPASSCKKRSSMADKLHRILDCIKAEDLSLPKFLIELFKSDNRIATEYTNPFYEAHGPRRLIEVWDEQLRNRRKHERWDESFVNSAVDVVIDRTLKHLDDNDVKKEWRLPHTNLTEDKVAGFLLDDHGFLGRYAAGAAVDKTDGMADSNEHDDGVPSTKGKNKGAKYLMRFLKGVLKEDVPVENLTKRAQRRRRARKPSSVRGCISAMLLFMTSQKTNAFQTVLGIFLHCTGCPRRVLEVLSGFGLSISYSQVLSCLKSLTKDAYMRVLQAVKENDFYLVYDNINLAFKHHHQRSNNRDTFDNGTAATVIIIPSDKNKPEPTIFCPVEERSVADANLFFPNDGDLENLFNVCQSHVSDSIVRSLPEGSTTFAIPIVPVEQLDLAKSTVFPLPVMKLDESTIAGNLSVLQRITEVGLNLPKSWFANPKNMFVAGDQMTVSRLLTLKVHRCFDPDPYHSLSWVHPVLQLFHLQMNLCGTIWRTHHGSKEFPGTLASIACLLNRKGLNNDKIVFHATDELLRIVFDAKVQLLYQFLRDHGVEDRLDVQSVTEIITKSCCFQPSPSLLGLPCTTANTNGLLFLRDLVVYIELGAAIKAGDIGRIKHVLPFIVMMMHGGGNTNYALELLRLLYGLRHLWTDDWARRVLSSMLVNPKGIDGGWMATDMMQENHNYLIKTIFSAKGSNMSWEYLQDSISANIKTFQSISRMFEREVGVRPNSTRHKKPSTALDILRIQENFRSCGILWTSGECEQGPPVIDLRHAGEEKMVGSAIGRFFENHTSLWGNAVDIEEAEGLENDIDQNQDIKIF